MPVVVVGLARGSGLTKDYGSSWRVGRRWDAGWAVPVVIVGHAGRGSRDGVALRLDDGR
jgi:hypothetical protein